MPTFADREFQARLLREIQEVNARKRKLEEDIRTVDAENKLLIEKAARRDIDAYRDRRHLSTKVVRNETGTFIDKQEQVITMAAVTRRVGT
jgi:hypothetical protein